MLILFIISYLRKQSIPIQRMAALTHTAMATITAIARAIKFKENNLVTMSSFETIAFFYIAMDLNFNGF